MTHKLVQVDSVQRFSPDRFCIRTELLGARHTFTYSNRQVSLVLPKQENTAVALEIRDVACYRWQRVGDSDVPRAYEVNTITLTVAGNQESIPEEALKVPPQRDELFTAAERERFAKLIDELTEVGSAAFQHWLKVLRWKSRIGHIGEPRIVNSDSGARGRLVDRDTNHRFWAQPVILTGAGVREVTLDDWKATQQALQDSKIPPIWFDFVFEGEQRLNNRDLTGAALSLAIAFEVMVRNLVTHHLADQRIEPLVTTIVDQANLRAILNRIKTLTFWGDDWNKVLDVSEFNKLMNLRDRIMHSADTRDLDIKELRKLHAKTKDLAYFVSTFLKKE